jgi:hypothetical protein
MIQSIEENTQNCAGRGTANGVRLHLQYNIRNVWPLAQPSRGGTIGAARLRKLGKL